MITYIKGDLIKDFQNYEVIVHGCNCFNSFGGGFAAGVAARFPEAYMEDLKTKKGDRAKLGTYTHKHISKDNVTIVNAYTQYAFGGKAIHADYDAIRSVFKKINKDFDGKKIGMPLIGAGLANGDWNTIEKIIQEELPQQDVTVVIWNK